MRFITPGKKLVQPFVYTPQAYPTSKPVVQYVRQSTDGQLKDNKQSFILQDKKLSERLIAYGWKAEDIIKIDTDQGKSGQKKRYEREGLDRLCTMVERGEVGAVAAFAPSRLYRDLTRVFSADFVHMCERYGIPVITFAKTYWPGSRTDMDTLMQKFNESANFIVEEVHEKMIAAKLQAIEESISYGGGAIPMGFTIANNEDRKYYAVYEEHARLIRWLYRRYRELNGNLGRLLHEIKSTGFAFPPFTGIERIPHVALPFVKGIGYPVKTRAAIVSMLTNPAYIGEYRYSGVLVSKQAHEAIVPMDDFLYAYSRLSATTLDGESNEDKPKVNRRYGARCDALLEGVLQVDGTHVYVMANRGAYVACTESSGWRATELVIPVERLDTAFSDVIRSLLLGLEQRHKKGLRDSLFDRLTEALQETTEQGTNYEKQLANIDKGIRQAEMDKKVALGEGYENGVREAVKQLKRLHIDKEALEAIIQRAGSERAELTECKSLLDVALRSWDKLPFERQKRFVRLMVERVNIKEETSHFLRIDILLREPFNHSLYGYLYRKRGSKSPWSEEEIATLTRLYPTASRLEILEALPTRTWESIVGQASSRHSKLQRATIRNTSDIYEGLTYQDYQLMVEHDIETLESQVKWVMCLTPIRSSSDSLWS